MLMIIWLRMLSYGLPEIKSQVKKGPKSFVIYSKKLKYDEYL